MQKNKGITLIALVVTIVVLLVISGVSVAVITGDNGILAKSQLARDKTQMAQYEEQIKMQAIEAKSQKSMGLEDGSIREKFIENLKLKGFIIQTADETAIVEEGQILIITPDGFEFIYEVSENANIELVSAGKGDGKPYPIVNLEQIALEGTKGEKVKIKVTTSVASGSITSIELLGTDGEKKDNPSSEEIFEVEGSGTYRFKVTTDQNKEIQKKITIAVNTVNGTINITANAVTARNTQNTGMQNGIATGPITLTIDYGTTEYQKQYKKEGDENWTTIDTSQYTITNITTNGTTIVARYYDGTNGYNQVTYNVENIDNVKPTFDETNVEISTNDNEITATVKTAATDTASESAGSGIAGILRYEYKLDEGNYSTSNTLTATTMGNHIVYVKAIDNAGNETVVHKEVNVGLESNTIKISATPTIPRNTTYTRTYNGVEQGPITLTINYGTTSFTKQYKKSTDENWTTVTSGNSVQISITENCAYVARYWDGTNGRETETYNITNVDNTAPTFTSSYITVSANDQGTITATVNTDATDASGIIRYEYKLDSESYVIGTSNLSKTKTFTTTVEGSHTVYVKAIDRAGNQKVVSKSVNVSMVSVTIGTTHSTTKVLTDPVSSGGLGLTWSKLADLADKISAREGTETNQINNDTMEVTITDGSGTYTLGIGDRAKVYYDGYKYVRIIGFNHDRLAGNFSKKSGITFEFCNLMRYGEVMNSSDTNSGGWNSCALKRNLNNTYLKDLKDNNNSIAMSTYIKTVCKEYIPTYNEKWTEWTSDDKLWLLSCGEIWADGYDGGKTRGYAITKEGEQYKYYKNINAKYNSGKTSLIKYSSGNSARQWWLRSPAVKNQKLFCFVHNNGVCDDGEYAAIPYGVSPGFAI